MTHLINFTLESPAEHILFCIEWIVKDSNMNIKVDSNPTVLAVLHMFWYLPKLTKHCLVQILKLNHHSMS